MPIQDFDEKYIPELRTVFYSSVHTNAQGYYNASQLEACAPVRYFDMDTKPED